MLSRRHVRLRGPCSSEQSWSARTPRWREGCVVLLLLLHVLDWLHWLVLLWWARPAARRRRITASVQSRRYRRYRRLSRRCRLLNWHFLLRHRRWCSLSWSPNRRRRWWWWCLPLQDRKQAHLLLRIRWFLRVTRKEHIQRRSGRHLTRHLLILLLLLLLLRRASRFQRFQQSTLLLRHHCRLWLCLKPRQKWINRRGLLAVGVIGRRGQGMWSRCWRRLDADYHRTQVVIGGILRWWWWWWRCIVLRHSRRGRVVLWGWRTCRTAGGCNWNDVSCTGSSSSSSSILRWKWE